MELFLLILLFREFSGSSSEPSFRASTCLRAPRSSAPLILVYAEGGREMEGISPSKFEVDNLLQNASPHTVKNK